MPDMQRREKGFSLGVGRTWEAESAFPCDVWEVWERIRQPVALHAGLPDIASGQARAFVGCAVVRA